MFGRARPIACPAGQWIEIINTAFAQMPKVWTANLRTATGEPVRGACEVVASSWIFPGTPERRPLEARMYFERGLFNTFYKVRVFAEVPTELSFE